MGVNRKSSPQLKSPPPVIHPQRAQRLSEPPAAIRFAEQPCIPVPDADQIVVLEK